MEVKAQMGQCINIIGGGSGQYYVPRASPPVYDILENLDRNLSPISMWTQCQSVVQSEVNWNVKI
jgi:hypothetical protein